MKVKTKNTKNNFLQRPKRSVLCSILKDEQILTIEELLKIVIKLLENYEHGKSINTAIFVCGEIPQQGNCSKPILFK